jgi:hypothetical protein
VADHLQLTGELGEGLVEVVQLVRLLIDLTLGVGRLHDNGLAGLTSLEDDSPQFAHRLLDTIEALGVVFAEGRLVEGHLSRRLMNRSAQQGEGSQPAGEAARAPPRRDQDVRSARPR